jgi:hypothetical protein
MSLLSTASPWNSEESNKKRTPTMRKTIKIRPYAKDIISEEADESLNYETSSTPTLEKVISDNDERNNRVNTILNQMSSVSPDNDGQNLVDFKPPPMPEFNVKKDLEFGKQSDEPIEPPSHPLQIPIPMIPKVSNHYVSSYPNVSNYQTVYDQSVPQYLRMDLGEKQDAVHPSSKMMEKINYMIHLLENQENEKTANVTEEFILYTFLGVFMIYVVDSFSRAGKYVR